MLKFYCFYLFITFAIVYFIRILQLTVTVKCSVCIGPQIATLVVQPCYACMAYRLCCWASLRCIN